MFRHVVVKNLNGGLESLEKLALRQRGVISHVPVPAILRLNSPLSPLTECKLLMLCLSFATSQISLQKMVKLDMPGSKITLLKGSVIPCHSCRCCSHQGQCHSGSGGDFLLAKIKIKHHERHHHPHISRDLPGKGRGLGMSKLRLMLSWCSLARKSETLSCRLC